MQLGIFAKTYPGGIEENMAAVARAGLSAVRTTCRSPRAQVAPGEGVLPWRHIIEGLADVGYSGAVITHALREVGVPTALRTLAPLLDPSA